MLVCSKIIYKLHALEQMFQRAISQQEVEFVIRHGETITAYPNDKPYPSLLRLAFIDNRPIHIVVAQNSEGECYIVTAYEPNAFLWNADFKTKKK
jgi:methylglyoxal synthase